MSGTQSGDTLYKIRMKKMKCAGELLDFCVHNEKKKCAGELLDFCGHNEKKKSVFIVLLYKNVLKS